MKKTILLALTLAAKYNKEKSEILYQRVIGDKKDVVTQGDIELGTIITQTLMKYQDKIIVESEENGKQTNFKDGEQEKFYIAIDDIDGTNNLRVGRGFLPYCSMIVVFDGQNKSKLGYKYSDYIYAACIDYVSERIFYTEKGVGKVEVYDLEEQFMYDSTKICQDNTNLALTLSTDIVSTQRGGLVGYAKKQDTDNLTNSCILNYVYQKFAIVDSGCSVFEYAMVGMGIRNGYVSSGKKQHELPLLYAFCNETGKKIVDFDGQSYDDKIYDFSAGDVEVIAGDENIIKEVIREIDRAR